MYVPGPHAGSLSGQKNDTARLVARDTRRDGEGAIAKLELFVLSSTDPSGRATEEAAGLGVDVCEGVPVAAHVSLIARRATPRKAVRGVHDEPSS